MEGRRAGGGRIISGGAGVAGVMEVVREMGEAVMEEAERSRWWWQRKWMWFWEQVAERGEGDDSGGIRGSRGGSSESGGKACYRGEVMGGGRWSGAGGVVVALIRGVDGAGGGGTVPGRW